MQKSNKVSIYELNQKQELTQLELFSALRADYIGSKVILDIPNEEAISLELLEFAFSIYNNTQTITGPDHIIRVSNVLKNLN
jgi:hypothetical protein